jgi:hypothetical protein
MSKYDHLALKCFGVTYHMLSKDNQMLIEDLYEEKGE